MPDAAALPLNMSALLRELAARGTLQHYRRKGIRLINEGDQGDTLFIILDGRLRVFTSNAAARELTLGVYGPGDYLGEMSLDGGPRSASVETLQACTCALVTRQTLTNFITEHPAFAFELLGKVIRRARAATLTATEVALNDVYGRLKLLLESLAEAPAPDGTRALRERLTHKEMANRLGCSREMVSRVMKDLEKGRYAATTEQGVILLGHLPARW